MIELAVVLPVYNEEDCIESVVEEWLAVLESLSIDFQLLILNDGSTDGTKGRLEAFRDNPRAEVVSKDNQGHGPTILRGYRTAVDVAEWVFQADSDREMPAEAFGDFWRARDGFDLLFGWRQGRKLGLARRILSAGAALIVRLFGGGVRDVNVPYRLMRSERLREMLAFIPPDTFAPNVAVSGLAGMARLRVANMPVPFRLRQTGKVSLVRWKMLTGAVRSFLQTLRILARRRSRA